MAFIETEARAIAGAFVAARRAGQALADYPGREPATLDEAYALQDAAIPLFGAEIEGWKVGRINSPWFEKLGVSRLAGPIFAHSVQAATGDKAAAGHIFKAGFGAVEAEFVFRIGSAPNPGQIVFGSEDAAQMIDAVFCGFEIASSPLAAINAMGPLVTISDFGNNNGLLLGPQIPDWQHARLDDWEVSTVIDGKPVGSGKAAAFPGGPMESVRFLIENLVQRGFPVAPGLLISSGAVTGVHEVSAGQFVESRFGDFCTMHCSIAHAGG